MYLKKKDQFNDEKNRTDGTVGFLEAKMDKVDKARYARMQNRAEKKQNRTDFMSEIYI